MTSHCYKKICPHQQIHWNVKIAVIFPSVQRTLSRLLSLVSLVSCLMSPVSRLLLPVSHFLSPVSLFPVSRFLSPVSILPSLCFSSSVSCLLSLFSCLSSCCFLSTVSRLQRCKCCRFSGVSDFMEQISGLGQFSDLLLADLADWKQIIFSGHEV